MIYVLRILNLTKKGAWYMDIVVLKFGGTSVADNEKLKLVSQKIIKLYEEGYGVVVVVSAQGKKTDSLISEAYELSNNPNSRELDVLLSTGEQVSISKLSILLNESGYSSISLTGWQAGIYTNMVNQSATIEYIDTKRIKEELNKNKIVVVAGFQGVNEYSDITTLGRGGSDTTAVALAAALEAKHCYIYSDVDGIYTSDPRKVTNPKKLVDISYDEMLDASNEGAKVLHNRCVELAKKYDIPLISKSTFADGVGTGINNKIESQKVKSIVKNDELISMTFCKNDIDTIAIYKILLENNVVPIEVINCDENMELLFKSNDLTKANHIIEQELSNPNIEVTNISRISIIGYGITNDSLILKRIINCLSCAEADIQKIDVNNGKVRITFKKLISNEILELLHSNLID